MRINPPTLFWILISAGLAADRFFPLMRFDAPWLPWAGGMLVVLGTGIAAAGKRMFRRADTNVYTFEQPDLLVTVSGDLIRRDFGGLPLFRRNRSLSHCTVPCALPLS